MCLRAQLLSRMRLGSQKRVQNGKHARAAKQHTHTDTNTKNSDTGANYVKIIKVIESLNRSRLCASQPNLDNGLQYKINARRANARACRSHSRTHSCYLPDVFGGPCAHTHTHTHNLLGIIAAHKRCAFRCAVCVCVWTSLCAVVRCCNGG